MTAVDAVRPSVFDEVSTRLVETERNLFGDALRTQIQNPIEITWPRPDTGLTTDTHLLYRAIQPSRDVHPLKHRRHNDRLMPYRKFLEYGKPTLGHSLVLHRAADDDILVPVAPVRRQTPFQTVNPFCKEIEHTVAPKAHHFPTFRPPRIRVLQQEIRSEAREDNLAGRNLESLVPLSFDRQIERRRLAREVACDLAPVHLVLPIDITEPAARTHLSAPVPRIPIREYAPLLRH